MLGVISKVEDSKKFIIKFNVDGIIENCIAYPFDMYEFSQPEVGDKIIVYGLETELGHTYMWVEDQNKVI